MKFTVPIATLLLAAISASARVCDEADPLFQWDAIVVGAGMSGSIIAAKIATKNPEKCVLVLEGGKHSGQVEDPISADAVSNSNGNFFDEWKNVSSFKNETHVNTPGTYGEKLVCWDRKCDYLWGEDKSRTPPGLIVGKLVGGSGAINGALMQYPPDYMWDAYPDGWKAEDMKEYLDEIERTMKPTATPSSDGIHYNDNLGANQVREAMEAVGYKFSDTAAYYKPTGGTMGLPRVTVTNGRRSSSASVYLKPVLKNNSNIKLWTETEVVTVNYDNKTKTAFSVAAWRKGKGVQPRLAEGGLVVVSAGGAKTPTLLLDSRIGPARGSTEVENDAVGKGLTDKSMTWIYFKVPGIELPYNYASPPPEDQDDFVKEGKGPLTQYGPLLVGFINIDSEVTGGKNGDHEHNIVEFFVSAASAKDTVQVYFVHLTPKKHQGGAVISSPTRYLGDFSVDGNQYDPAFSSASLEKAKEVITNAMAKKGYERTRTDEWVGLNNMNHPGGTCELGKCIDSDTLIVKGVKNIAVCDNSIVPEQATVHTALSLMAIASKAGDILNGFFTETETKDEL